MEHKHAIEWLRRWLEAGRLPHAFLLLGEVGALRRFAQEAAQFLTGQRGATPDLDWIEILEGESESSLSAEELRERVHAALQLRPVGERRVFVLLGADRLSPEALDVLLKPLEEPPANSVMFLGAPDANAIPETLRSRCRILRLTSVAGADECSPAMQTMVEAAQARFDRAVAASDLEPFLGEIFGAKKGDLSQRRERAREFLQAWIGVQQKIWRAQEGLAELAAQRAEAGIAALADLQRQVTPEIALAGLFFSLARKRPFVTQLSAS